MPIIVNPDVMMTKRKMTKNNITMKYILFPAAIALLTLCAGAQQKGDIVIGQTDSLYSAILKEKRKIRVYTPTLTSSDAGPGKRYPVLYLLDGDAHFISTVGLIHQLSQANGNAVLPEMIVVGIDNTDRMRDLSPALPEPGKKDVSNSFVRFLKTELMPHVEKNYPVAPYKILVGHSLGGLMAIDILANQPEMFHACLAIDPSMWYNDEKHLQHAIAQLPQSKLQGRRLFVGMANTLPKGITLSMLTTDRTKETQHIRSIIRLDSFLTSNPVPGLKYAYRYYPNESHVSVPLISEYDGLRFLFDYYLMDITENDFKDSTAHIAIKYKTHYERISAEMGYAVTPPEAFIRYLAYDARARGHINKAEALLQLIPGSQPDSPAETDLKKYEGDYLIDAYQIPVRLKLRKGVLWAIVPGQADSELIPASRHQFTLRNKPGYLMTFQMEGDKPAGFTSVQPNGIFVAKRK